jgi:hypothetical protein
LLKKIVAPLLIGTVMLLTLVPSKAFSQAPSQPQAADSAHALSERQLKAKPDLKAVFAKEMANIQARTLTAEDYERLEKKRQDDASKQATKKGWTRGEKIGLVVFIGVMTAFTIAVLIRGINTEPNCVEDPFALNCS